MNDTLSDSNADTDATKLDGGYVNGNTTDCSAITNANQLDDWHVNSNTPDCTAKTNANQLDDLHVNSKRVLTPIATCTGMTVGLAWIPTNQITKAFYLVIF